ncbi:MAG: enoyl-CoA hydratase, partial [Mesorhizobium sp.]
MTDLVLSETRDRVAILTLNRPDRLNALNYALIDRLLSRLDLIETDDGVR